MPGDWTRVAVNSCGCAGPPAGWHGFADAAGEDARFVPDGPTMASDPLLLYFTSGTTAQPKLVEHTHASYPVGHLSTMYWIGLQPGDVHLNISSPGWAKHAWSNVYAPWNAGATALVLDYDRFSAQALLQVIGDGEVSTFCAPPTVWRMLIQADLAAGDVDLAAGVRGRGRAAQPRGDRAGPPRLGDHGPGRVRADRDHRAGRQPAGPGRTARVDGPAAARLPGGPGRPADRAARPRKARSAWTWRDRPLGLMTGYRGDPERAAEAMRGGYYHTGDVASRDGDGYLTYVGRTDDVFKASDYRISPFELESVLIEHEAVAEAAVVPSPDPMRFAVPKAYVTLTASARAVARDRAGHPRPTPGSGWRPYKRVRRIEFSELPKTISGKIRRVELRSQETDRLGPPGSPAAGTGGTAAGPRGTLEFWEEDFPTLKG